VGEDGLKHVHDGYVVIEEFDRVRNPLSIEVSLEKPIEPEVDSVNGGYRYSSNKNAIRVIYRNAAPNPMVDSAFDISGAVTATERSASLPFFY
jgi:hypothetical protein